MIWKRGPSFGIEGPVVVSVGELTLSSVGALPSVSRAALRLRRSWTDMEGAVGLAFDGQLTKLRAWAISVWESETDLQRFLTSPAHLAVQKAHRSSVHGRSLGTWTVDHFDRARVEQEGRSISPTT